MTSLPEQFNAARKAQFEAGFDFFQSFANQAIESAGRVAALNLATSRDSLERSARTARALISSRDPRDLLMLGGHAEEQVRSLFTYGRELMGIAGGIRPVAVRLAAPAARIDVETVAFKAVVPAPQDAAAVSAPAAAAAAEPAASEAPTVDAAPEVAPKIAPEIAPKAAATAAPVEPVVVAEPEPAVELVVTATEVTPAPVGEPKAIAKAAAKGIPRAAVVPHPAAAPVAPEGDAELPKVEVQASSPRRKK
ncbi:MAG: phasin family protein [Janthinobacterium lividum]